MSEIIKWGFYLYIGLIPLIPEPINSKYHFTDFYLVLLVLCYLLNMISSKDKREKFLGDMKRFFTDSIIISMLIFLIVMGISVTYATDKSIAIQEIVRFTTYIALLYYIISEINIKDELSKIVNFIYIPAFIIGILGIVQYFTKIGIQVTTAGVMRIESTLGHPNSLGLYFVILLFPLIPLLGMEKNKYKKSFYIFLVVVMLVNIILSYSRNSWLALAVGLVILAMIYNWKLLIGLIVTALGMLMVPTLRLRLIDMGAKIFSDGRIKHWKVALEMFKDNPLLGVGNGNYVTLHEEYLVKYPQFIVPGEENFPTHNSYLKVLSELGILGFIPFIILHGLIILRAFMVCKTYSKKYRGVIKGIIVSLLVFLQANLIDNMLFVPAVATMYWLMVGIIILLQRRKKYNY